MKTMIMTDKFIIAEVLSVITFWFFILYITQNPTFKLSEQDSLFWSLLFVVFSFLQLCSIIFKENLQFLRICMTWVSGSLLTWLSYANRDSFIIYPMVIIGLTNFLSFINLCNKVSVDWNSLIND